MQTRRYVASFVPSTLTLSLKRYDFFDLSRAFFPTDRNDSRVLNL